MVLSRVFVAGASRGVGREIAHCLQQQNLKIRTLLRTEAVRSELEALGIEVVLGDALNASEVEQALVGGEPVDAVISTIGGVDTQGRRSDYWGNKNLIDAAVQANVQKFILVSSIGAGETVVALSPQILEALRPALIEKEKAEQHLIASGLTYTIVRPGGLKSEPATGQGVLTETPTASGMIHRADVAQLVVQCLLHDSADNRIFSAVDRQMLYSQTPLVEVSLTGMA